MTTPWPDTVAIVIPAYKAAALLEKLLPSVLAVVPPECILIVDDASKDTTTEVADRYAVKCVSHESNKGKGGALVTGFAFIMKHWQRVRWIVTMDADGQHSPDDLHLFTEAITGTPTPGICIGARLMKRDTMPPARIFSNRLTSWILGLFCGVPIQDSQCGYRIYNTGLLKQIQCDYTRFEMESEVIMKAAFLGFPVTFTPIQTLYLDGPSHIAHLQDTVRWVAAGLRMRLQRKKIVQRATTAEQDLANEWNT